MLAIPRREYFYRLRALVMFALVGAASAADVCTVRRV
jgi:hypothetical protein